VTLRDSWRCQVALVETIEIRISKFTTFSLLIHRFRQLSIRQPISKLLPTLIRVRV
jgi:hypothetical protein